MVTKDEMDDIIASWITKIMLAVLVGVLLGTFGIPVLFGLFAYGPPTMDKACPENMDEGMVGMCRGLWDYVTNWWWVSVLAGILLPCRRLVLIGVRVAVSLIPGSPVKSPRPGEDD